MAAIKSTTRQRKLTKELFEIESKLLYGQKKPERIIEIEFQLMCDGLMDEEGCFRTDIPTDLSDLIEQYM